MDNFTMSENSGSFGMQQRQDRFDAIGDLIVGPPGPPGPQGPPGADGTVSFDELTPAQRESLRGEGVPAGGTTGQVLAKASNTDYATEWVDQSGGSASMTILSYGNSTWADFIAAYRANSIVYCRASSAADPSSGSQTRLAFMAYVNNATSPTSVEFQYYRSVSSHSDSQQGDQVFIYKLTSAGAWTVTVRDAFTKIAAGSNMTSSYANGTLTLGADMTGYRTAAAQDAIDAAQDAQIEVISHRNLLDNWYFVGGGSQLGSGTFPINQRGQASYTTLSAYGIDRWKLNATVGCTLSSGYASFEGMSQVLTNPSRLVGKTLTASILLASGVLYSGTAILSALDTSTIFYQGNNITLRYSFYWAGFQMYHNTSGSSLNVVAVKLELGSYQTLAHNEGTEENPNWVLNEIPDYGDELEKCRRYFRVLESTPGDGNRQYFVAARGYSDASYINVAVEAPMMNNIVPSLPDGIQGAAIDGAGTSANLSGVSTASSNKSFGIRTASNLARTPIAVYLNKRIYLSAES